MLTLDAKEFVELLHVLLQVEQDARGKSGRIDDKDRGNNDTGILETIRRLQALDLPVSVTTAQQMRLECRDAEKFHRGIEQLRVGFETHADCPMRRTRSMTEAA